MSSLDRGSVIFALLRRLAAVVIGGAVASACFCWVALPAQASTALGTQFRDENYNGPSLTITTSINGYVCTVDRTSEEFHYWDLSGTGLNDQITSFMVYAGCFEKLWDDAGLCCNYYGYYSGSYNVGPAMNDRASSIQWT